MANNIKGITIEIGGNTGPLTTALKDVDSTSRNLQNELKEVNRQLKFDPKNVDLLRQKEELTSKTADALKERQAVLKQAVEQAHAAFEKGDLGADKVRAVEREYAKVSSQIKDLESQHTSFFSKVKDKLNITNENVKTAVGTVGIVVGGFLKSCITSASEAGNAEANLAQTVKSTGGAAGMTAKQMEELAQKEMNVSTFSKDDIESGEAMMLTFTKIGKDVFPQATQAMLNFAQKMGTDPKAAALTLGKALNDPVTGLSKLTKAGVTFTAQQKQQITAMEKAGNTAGAQKVMLAELNKEFGGQAAAAAGTYAGKQKQLANEFKEVKESIGNALIPVLTQLASYLVKILQPIAQFISQHPKITAAILAVIAVVWTLIGGLSVLNTVTSVFGITLDATLLPTIGLVVIAIMALAAAAALIIANWSGIKGFFTGIWSGIKSGASGVGNAIKNAFLGAVSGVKSAWNGVKTFFSTLLNGIKAVFITVWNGIKTAVMAIVTPFINSIKAPFNTLKTGLSNIMNGIKSVFSGAWTLIKTITLGPVLLICDLVTGNFTKLHTDLTGILNNIKNGFSSVWNGIKSVVVGIVQALVGAVGTIFSGGASILHSIGSSIANFFSGLWNGIRNTTSSIWNGILGFFSGLPGRFSSFMSGVGSAIVHGFDSAINFIKNLPSRMLEWGKDMIQGLINGIKNMIGKVGDAVSSVGDKIRSFLHFSKPDEGPLADYETWMPDLMSGLVKGIENNKNKVANAIKGLATDVSVGMKLTPALAKTGSASTINQGTSKQNNGSTIINFNGNYTFTGKKDIDYFMNQAALLVQRRK